MARPSTSAAISLVSGAPASSTICASGGRSWQARIRYGRPFCRVIRPTKTTLGRLRSMPSRSITSVPRSGAYCSVSMPLWTTRIFVRVDRRVRGQHVPLHAPGHRDDRVGGLDRGALAERGQRVPAAELLGLPRAQRLEAVRGDHVRHAVQQLGGVAGEVRVPGVAVHDVGARAAGRHLQVDAHRAQRGVRAGQLGRLRVRGDARLVALAAEAVHPDVGQARRSRARYSTWTPAPPYTSGGYSRVSRSTRRALDGFEPESVTCRRLVASTGVRAARWLASLHGSQGARDRSGRWRRQAPDAADRGPGQARRPVRRYLPHDRLRPVQPRQRRVSEDRRADPVQVPLARPAHHQDLADVDAARQLRHPGAGAAAARPALVRRLGRRHLPEPQPDQRREAGLRHRLRRGPHLPDGPEADGGPAHRLGRRGHRGRHPPAQVDVRPVRRHRRRRGRPADQRVPGEAHRGRRPARRAGRDLRLDGQLRLHHPGAVRGGQQRRAGPGQQARHGRQHHPDAGRAGRGERLRLPRQRRAGQHRPRPRLLARRGDAGLVLRRAHGPDRHPAGVQPLQHGLADLHQPGAPGRRPSSCTASTTGRAAPSSR